MDLSAAVDVVMGAGMCTMERGMAVVVLACGVAACSGPVELKALGLSYQPAAGVALQEESAGPPARAVFKGDLQFVLVPSPLGELEEKKLEALLQDATARAGVKVEGTVASAKVGSLHLGPVARYEIKEPTRRTLVYLVPRGATFLCITLSAPTGEYVKVESTFERTLSSIKVL